MTLRITLEILDTWDAATRGTERTRPRGSAAVLLDWHIEPHPQDSGVPAEIAIPAAAAFTRIGDLLFRLFDEPVQPRPGLRLISAPPRTAVRRLVDWATTAWPVDLALASDPDAAAELFEQGWDMQGQAGLIVQRGAQIAATTLAALRTARDLRDFPLARPLLGLIAPAVDGWGILVAAETSSRLEPLVEALVTAFAASGLPVEDRRGGAKGDSERGDG